VRGELLQVSKQVEAGQMTPGLAAQLLLSHLGN